MKIYCKKTLNRILGLGLVLIFGATHLVSPAHAQGVPLSPSFAVYEVPMLLGLKIHPENPFLFDFIVDPGKSNLTDPDLKNQSEQLVKYFMAALTLPDKDVWVNLSPEETQRIIPSPLDRTEMGKVMLQQDFQLKQLAASLTNPQTDLGKKYWEHTGAKGQRQTASEANRFNRVWIVPGKAKVIENNGIVWIDESHLQVLMDGMHSEKGVEHSRQDQVFEVLILPKMNEAVNAHQDFSTVRQVYHAVILAAWYKRALKETLLGKIYTDKAKTPGVEINDPNLKQRIYESYLETFKKGAYNLIKEEEDETTGEIIPRKYFSGGITPADFGQGASSTLVQETVPLAELGDRITARLGLRTVTVQVTETGQEGDNLKVSSSPAIARVTQIMRAGAELFNGLNKYGSGVFQDAYLTSQYVSPIDKVNRLKLARVLFQFIYWRVATSQGTNLSDQQWLEFKTIEPLKSLLAQAQVTLDSENLPFVMKALTFQKEGIRYANQAMIGTMFADIQAKGLSSASSAPVEDTLTPKTTEVQNTQEVGGIDFDPSRLDLQIKRDPRGVPLPLPEQNLEGIQIQGLYPVIIRVAPINAQTLPLFLGQVSAPEQQNSLQSKG